MPNTEIAGKLKDLVDLIETEYGDIEGFSVKLEHPVKDGKRQGFADIKEFVIYYLHKEVIGID